jgi:hypothetical protein
MTETKKAAALAEPAIKPDLTTEPVADALIRKYIAALVANRPDEAANATKAMVDYVYTTPQPKAEQEPGNWTVYNSGAEVASGLSFSEAWEYMTPERLARQWCAVCVVDKSNLPTVPQPRKRLTDEEIDQMWSDAHNDTTALSLVKVFARAIEAAVWGDGK